MVGSRVQHPGTIAEEQTVGVVRNHKDGTRSASADGGPKAKARKGLLREWTLRIVNDGGAIFDNPKRGSSAYPRRAA